MPPSTYKTYFANCKVTGVRHTVSLKGVYYKGGDTSIPANYGGTCSECGKKHRANRIIVRPFEPSNHVCDERCIHATGQRCECSCGGENHGIGGLGINAIGL